MSNYVLETPDEFATRRNNENINNFNDGYNQALVDVLEMIKETKSLDYVYESIGGFFELFERNKENKFWKDLITRRDTKTGRATKAFHTFKDKLDNNQWNQANSDKYSRMNAQGMIWNHKKKISTPSFVGFNAKMKSEIDKRKLNGTTYGKVSPTAGKIKQWYKEHGKNFIHKI